MTNAPVAPSTLPPRRRWGGLAPLRHRNYALVFAGGTISNLGTWMETVAVGDLVADRTGQAGWTALVAAAGFLPMGLLGPVGGAIADRVDRRRFLLLTTALQLACAAVLTVLAATDHVSPPVVAAVVFVAGCVQGIGFPAYLAMVPDLVQNDEVLAATSLNQAQWNLGRVLGPALAGVAIALGSYTAAFAINAVSFAAMLLAWRALDLPPTEPSTDTDGLWTRMATGARAAWAEPGVRSAIIVISVVALTASPFISLIPAMARVRHGGSSSLTSWFVSAQGVGAVIGARADVRGRTGGRHRLPSPASDCSRSRSPPAARRADTGAGRRRAPASSVSPTCGCSRASAPSPNCGRRRRCGPGCCRATSSPSACCTRSGRRSRARSPIASASASPRSRPAS